MWGHMGGASDPVSPVQGHQTEVVYKVRPEVCAAGEKREGEQRCPSRVSRCKSSETLGEFCSFEEVKVAKCCYWFMACAEASLAGRWDQGLFVCLVFIHLFVFACAGSSFLHIGFL